MGEIAGVAPRFLGLLLAMRQQFVDLVHQRIDFAREILGDAALAAGADGDHLAPHPPQRPQAVARLERGQHQQAEPERGEAPDQGGAEVA